MKQEAIGFWRQAVAWVLGIGACLLALALLAAADWLMAAEPVKGYFRKDGTYVQPHVRSAPNDSKFDNYSAKGNINPYTGKAGTDDPLVPFTGAAHAPVQSRPAPAPLVQRPVEATPSNALAPATPVALTAEERIARLEKRVAELEAALRRSTVAAPAVTPDKMPWRQLKRSMSRDQVRSVLGEPLRISGGYLEHWYYSNMGLLGAHVTFSSNQLTEWTEP